MNKSYCKTYNVLLVMPHNHNRGGVANYYNAVLPYLNVEEFRITSFQIGSSIKGRNKFYPIIDQLKFNKVIGNRPDIVHVNPSLGWKSFFRDGLFIWQAKRKSLRVLVFFRGWDKQFETFVDRCLGWFFRRTFGKADHFIVLAIEFEQHLRKWGVQKPIQLGTTAVNNTLLIDFDFNKKLSRLRQTQNVKILFLARLERDKGVYETIDAVRILLDKDVSISLSIAGDGLLMEELQDYIGNLGFPKNCINLLGYVSGKVKSETFAKHDIYSLPSYYGEGLPNSVLEAMAFGLPVITRLVGGLADFFEDDNMGFLVNKKAPDEIALCVERLIYDREKMVQIAEYNYAYAREHFMAPKVASYLRDVYRSILTSQ